MISNNQRPRSIDLGSVMSNLPKGKFNSILKEETLRIINGNTQHTISIDKI